LTSQHSSLRSRRATFADFADRKRHEAEGATLTPLRTIEDCTRAHQRLTAIGNAWTRRHYDGDFFIVEPPPHFPAMSAVFVQSRDGNTGADSPDDLGGGDVDKHLIYEGLSRVAVDAVLAGAGTARGPHVFFSVWHPQMVSLRRDLGLPRHPAQIVISRDGHVDLDSLLFNVPDVPVFLMTGAGSRDRLETSLRERSWITLVALAAGGPAASFSDLRTAHHISRISVVGGRTTASSLIDAGLIQDLHLTTTARAGGQPNTPFYTGRAQLELDPIVRKQGAGDLPIQVEHVVLTQRPTP
jgi:riboflavin biosynthesis pyrimidine reductase